MSAASRRLTGPPQWELSDRIRRIRRSMGLDQRAFAELLEITPSALSGYETGRFKPDDVVGFAQHVEIVTGVPAAWVLGLDVAVGAAEDDRWAAQRRAAVPLRAATGMIRKSKFRTRRTVLGPIGCAA